MTVLAILIVATFIVLSASLFIKNSGMPAALLIVVNIFCGTSLAMAYLGWLPKLSWG